MNNIIKIAWRNLLRYTRRTLLTSSLIALGVALVIVFGGVGNSFRGGVIEIITNSNLGHLQVHKKGYIGSMDNLPLDLSIGEKGLEGLRKVLDSSPEVLSYSERIRFGAMISNFASTTNMRLTAVHPEKESATCPDLPGRIKEGESDPAAFVKPGAIVLPQNIASGLGFKLGDEVVLVANNKDGSVNGLSFRLSGISENIMGPQGKDGYIHLEDARTLLRIEGEEVTEVAVKLKDFDRLTGATSSIKKELADLAGAGQKPGAEAASGAQPGRGAKAGLEVHTWEELSPFASIAKMVALLIIVVRLVLVFIVLVSVLNVMMMSVYERVGEIGTMASIGTPPNKILALFLTEGLSLGFFSGVIGSAAGAGILLLLKALEIPFTFGSMDLVLSPSVPVGEIALALLVVIVISALASLQPALKASRMEPVDALRHV
ncbi:MAG: ABC transporter substrate-binding protein [Elusimicrobia bacterium HGW-Elusimicrobia-3]|nr:MAG: ABC transporter substrate-binding protein [Elusimicrobia bacterium HGW-Elusimicrobia-3]